MEWGKGVNKGSGKTGVDAKGEEKKAGDVSRTGSGLVEPTPVKVRSGASVQPH